MNPFFRSLIVCTVVSASAAYVAPAGAALATDYQPPKVAHLGKSSVSNAGSGKVVVKVLVKANGSFQVMNVIRSSNAGNNAAALDIARRSSYRVGLKGGKPATAFYDFTIKFIGKLAAADDLTGATASVSGGNAQTLAISRMIHAGNYSGAKAAAATYLSAHPGDSLVETYVGIANLLTNDDASAAAAFDKAGSIPRSYQGMAAQAFALAAVQLQQSDPQQALAYARKAMSIRADSNSYFALGVAQLANQDVAGAVTNLEKARQLQSAEGHAQPSVKVRLSVDGELLKAYLAAGETVKAQSMVVEMKQLDPASNVAARMIAQHSFDAALAAENAGKLDEAIADYEAAAQADPESAVTGYARAALVMGRMTKPDFKRMKVEADKAISAKANDPQADYAEGVALLQLSALSSDNAMKSQGMAFLKKADAEAQAAGMMALATAIENTLKGIK